MSDIGKTYHPQVTVQRQLKINSLRWLRVVICSLIVLSLVALNLVLLQGLVRSAPAASLKQDEARFGNIRPVGYTEGSDSLGLAYLPLASFGVYSSLVMTEPIVNDPPPDPEPDPGPLPTDDPPIVVPPIPPSGPVGPG